MNNGLKSLLEGLGLLSNEAVFFRDEKNGLTYNGFSSETQKKLNIIQPNAFFIFNNQPYILFFDLTGIDNNKRENEIHKQVWSFDYSPLIFVVKETEVQIFNAFNFSKKDGRLQEIKLSEDVRNNIFSFWNLQSGESWKWLQEEYYKTNIQKKRVNQKLFENIRLVRETLSNPKKDDYLNEDEANILILRLIFIRYLIDRNVKMNPEYITGDSILERRKSFSELIRKPRKLNQFFTQLNEKFNGVLFKDIKVQLSREQATYLSWVFNEKSDPTQSDLFDGSDFYFEIFDFSIIPVEVISGIYESLINEETRNEQSAVYTPSFLVEYILSETIDHYLDKFNTSESKIFDPSCGSGIFLVQSYRRMVDKEKALYGERVKKSRLKEIAQKNLFGIDLNPQALKVTCFSLYIAILDYQDPKTILDNFHFPKLINENLFEADFFEQQPQNAINQTLRNISFDFILGNPPWKKDKSIKHLDWVNSTETYNKKITGELEIAQSFLLRSKDFMQPHTISALIVTSMVFYNVSSTTKEFKKFFLLNFCINKFFDLSPVRRLIFEEKISPASIVFYHLPGENKPLTNIVKHISVKSNIFLKYFKTLIIEKFDQKEIHQMHFVENDWMFKVALYGNTLDFSFLKKLKKTKEQIIDLFDGITMFKGAGIHKGTKEKFKSFTPLIGKEIIENNEVEKYYSFSKTNNSISKSDSYIKSGREKGLYEGTQILIKEQAKNESEIVVSLSDKSYVFRSGVFSLSSINRSDDILCLFSFLISDLYEYYVFITSGSWGVSTRPQIRLDDEYLTFPFIKPDKKTKAELLVLVNEFIKPYKNYHKSFSLGNPEKINTIIQKINIIIQDLYKVSQYEIDLIDYVLNISRYQFQEGKQDLISKKINNNLEILKMYANVFSKEFKIIYPDEFLKIEIYPLNYFIAMNFIFQNEKPPNEIIIIQNQTDEKDVLKRIANNLSISKLTNCKDSTKSIFIQKDIKGFEQNSFYIIKPNEYKCWHRAIAWYDVAEIKEAIEHAELNYLKDNPNGA